MTEWNHPIAEWSAGVVELIGISIIVLFSFYTVGAGTVSLLRRQNPREVFRDVRHRLAAGILLGLEFLVAADIIHTVAVELTFKTVAVLAIIILIRTFLSFSLELELNGRWPWQARNSQ